METRDSCCLSEPICGAPLSLMRTGSVWNVSGRPQHLKVETREFPAHSHQAYGTRYPQSNNFILLRENLQAADTPIFKCGSKIPSTRGTENQSILCLWLWIMFPSASHPHEAHKAWALELDRLLWRSLGKWLHTSELQHYCL